MQMSSSQHFERYGETWKQGTDPLRIEMYAIQKGGKWKNSSGKECGEGLSHHYEQMRRIIWPELDDHRWHRLTRDAMVNNKVTVMLGSGSSGKTHAAAWYALCEYFCFPDDICILVSSTDIRGLKKRIFGEIVSLFQKAIDRFDYLPGNSLDSAVAITTDDLEDCEPGDRRSRDMRKGIFGIPCKIGNREVGISAYIGVKQKKMRLIGDELQCFPAGTMIDTPHGVRPIESLSVGDSVLNATGFGRIKQIHNRTATKFVKLKFSNGKEMECTANHPVFTSEGWKCAWHVGVGDYMLSTYEAMSLLPEHVCNKIQQSGLPGLPGENVKPHLCELRESIQGIKNSLQIEMLRHELFCELEAETARSKGKNLHSVQIGKDSIYPQKEFCSESGKVRGHVQGNIQEHKEMDGQSYTATAGGKEQTAKQKIQDAWSEAACSWWERNRANKGGKSFARCVLGVRNKQLPYQNRNEKWKRISGMLQTGLGVFGYKTGRGSGWNFSRFGCEEISRRKENSISCGAWVDSVEIYERKSSVGFGKCDRGIEVYNFEVEGHPSYSVNGFLVHNCMSQNYLSAFANLNNNVDFKAVLMGNPSDQFDPLGVAAEPIEGWDSQLNPGKTTTWRGKFFDACVVNLVGTDSPNFDFPESEPDKYPYLVGRKKVRETKLSYGEDSYEFFSQCLGVMKVANMTQRVISQQMCEQHGAMLEPQWGSAKRTRIMSIDAAYGGDRCVAGEGEFGMASDGKIILAASKPIIIPVSVKSSMSPEDQIAEWVFKYSTANEIPPDKIFYDSTGRGSLGAAFAKVFGYSIPVPVEFGGKPTKRPVRADFYIRDNASGSKRLKRCDEHYDRFVTELWFSARYAIEAGQIRGLSKEHVYEGSMRQYKDISGNKVSIETKDDMKERLRRSPDLFDQFVTLIEGARRLGFNIARLGAGQDAEFDSKQWLRDLDRKSKDLNDSKQLQYN